MPPPNELSPPLLPEIVVRWIRMRSPRPTAPISMPAPRRAWLPATVVSLTSRWEYLGDTALSTIPPPSTAVFPVTIELLIVPPYFARIPPALPSEMLPEIVERSMTLAASICTPPPPLPVAWLPEIVLSLIVTPPPPPVTPPPNEAVLPEMLLPLIVVWLPSAATPPPPLNTVVESVITRFESVTGALP